MAPSSIFKASNIASHPYHHITFFFYSEISIHFPHIRTLVTAFWVQVYPHLKILNLTSSAKSLSPYKVTGTGSRDSLLGAIIQPTMAYPQWREDRAQNLPDSCLRAIELILQFLSLPDPNAGKDWRQEKGETGSDAWTASMDGWMTQWTWVEANSRR